VLVRTANGRGLSVSSPRSSAVRPLHSSKWKAGSQFGAAAPRGLAREGKVEMKMKWTEIVCAVVLCAFALAVVVCGTPPTPRARPATSKLEASNQTDAPGQPGQIVEPASRTWTDDDEATDEADRDARSPSPRRRDDRR